MIQQVLPSSLAVPIWQRIMRMTAVWLMFGMFIGATTGPGRDLLGIISGMIAGVILLPWLAVPLALTGGRARDAALGGVFGAMVGALCATSGQHANVLYEADVALMIGAMIGANYSAISQWLKRRNRRALTVAN